MTDNIEACHNITTEVVNSASEQIEVYCRHMWMKFNRLLAKLPDSGQS